MVATVFGRPKASVRTLKGRETMLRVCFTTVPGSDLVRLVSFVTPPIAQEYALVVIS